MTGSSSPPSSGGRPLRVLEDLGGLRIAEVKEIRRQTGAYREAVRMLSDGKAGEALDRLDAMGCVKLLPVWDDYAPIAKEYADKLESAGPKDRDRAALIVCPTHAEGDRIDAAVRQELRGRGLIGGEERTLRRLSPIQWTAAERGDAARYAGDEVVQFHRNSGAFKAGEQVDAADAIRLGATAKPDHFAVYGESTIGVSKGDQLRVTAKGKSLDGRHTLTNGAVYRVAGFDRAGDVVLSNGWTVGKNFGHWAHAYVNTAYASQGRTVDHVIVAQSAMSYPAVSKEAFYVAVSRGRHSVSIFTTTCGACGRRSARARRDRPRPSWSPSPSRSCGVGCGRRWPTSSSPPWWRRGRPSANSPRNSGSFPMSDNKVATADSFLQKFLPTPPAAEEEEGLPSLKEKEYRPHARPSNKPAHSLHFITPDGAVRTFQYVHLDSDSRFTPERITLRFMGIAPQTVTIEGRNLWRLYDYIHQHRLTWVMQVARDYAENGQTVVTRMAFAAIKAE